MIPPPFPPPFLPPLAPPRSASRFAPPPLAPRRGVARIAPSIAARVLGPTALAAVLLHAAPARAGDEAAAEALFEQAKKLAAEGRYAEACPKFAESNRLDRGAGTLIHLADCYEKNKQTASAWATFREASSAAQALGRADWQKLATERAAALEPRLARLTIKVEAPADGLVVTRDGAPASAASWGTPLPVDIGTHTVHAAAPGRRAFDASVVVAADGTTAEVVVPKLAPGGERADEGGANAAREGGSAQRTVGLVLGGVGIAGLAVGVVTGLVAMGKNSDSKAICPNDGPCGDRDAVDANDSAKSTATVSTVSFVAGGVLLATGAVLVLTAPSRTREPASSTASSPASPRAHGRTEDTRAHVRIAPSVDPRGAGGLLFTGVF